MNRMSESRAEPSAEPILLSVVIPVFNEVANLDLLISELEAADLPRPFEVILVDDGSRDGSWAKIESASNARPWLRGLRLVANRGQTAAMVAGIDHAKGALIGFLDADLQNDARDLKSMVASIQAGEADMVCGWRAKRHDHATRTIPSRIANQLITRAFGLRIHDLGCTLKVCRREFLEEMRLYGEMHRFIPCYVQSQGAIIREQVVSHRPRHLGSSKYGFERIGKVVMDIFTTKLLNTYGAKPAYFFGKIALVFFALGAAAFSVVAYRVIVLGRPESTPMIFIVLMTYMTGLICLVAGLLAELSIRVLHEAGHRRIYRIAETTDGSREGTLGPCAE